MSSTVEAELARNRFSQLRSNTKAALNKQLVDSLVGNSSRLAEAKNQIRGASGADLGEAGVQLSYIGSNIISELPSSIIVTTVVLILFLILFFYTCYTGLYKVNDFIKKNETVKGEADKVKNFINDVDGYYNASIGGAVVVGFTCFLLFSMLIYFSRKKFLQRDFDTLEELIVNLDAERAYKRAKRPITSAINGISREYFTDSYSKAMDIANDASRLEIGKKIRSYDLYEDHSPFSENKSVRDTFEGLQKERDESRNVAEQKSKDLEEKQALVEQKERELQEARTAAGEAQAELIGRARVSGDIQ